ncbi:MAG: hypothetical protein O2958_14870 [Gemmatimonadetes bacterium]|nr:hypothetical protein [Gemmatimonadota bacterium]MDA1104423.1 hypothetical protein [Gemmatimonadota bacterium]
MRVLAALLLCAFLAVECEAQIAVEVSYGVDRNVDSSEARRDGWLNGTVEWMLPSGLGIGIGTDHQFSGVAPAPSDFRGWALYASTSFEMPDRKVSPFVRGGIGAGRAPCQGDTCTDGLYLRASTGLRVRVAERLRLSTEIGVSRVSRPFGGVGLSFRF